jgi:hypothetical protein
MATEDISLRIKLDQVEAELRKIPGLTDATFKKMVAVASKEFKDLEKAARDAARAQEKAAKEAAAAQEKAAREAAAAQVKAYDDVKKGATVAFGGVVGDIEDVTGAMKSLVIELGPVGAGLAAAGIALVALPGAAALAVAGIVELVDVAQEAIEGVQKLGDAKIVTDDQIEAVQRAADTIDFFQALISQAAIVLVSDLGPQLDNTVVKLGTFTLETIKSLSAVLKYFDAVQLAETMLAAGIVELTIKMMALANPIGLMTVAALKLAEAVTGTDQGLADLNEQIRKVAWSTAKSVTGLDAQSAATEDLTYEQMGLAGSLDEYLRKAEQERKAQAKAAAAKEHAARAARDNAAALKAEADAYAELGRIAAEATSDQQTDLDKIVDAWQKRTEAAQKAIRDEADLAFALDEINQRFYRDFAALKAKEVKTAQDAAKKEAEAVAAWSQKQADTRIQEQQRFEAERIASGERMLAAIRAEIEAENAEMERLNAMIATSVGAFSELRETLLDMSKDNLAAIRDERTALKEKIKDAEGWEKAHLEQRLQQLEEEATGFRKMQQFAYKTRKAVAISEALINGAVAATRALAELGPVAGGIAAAAITATVGAQVAAIMMERPKFHTGLDPSETPAVLTKGEGVANVRAMAQPGFREQLAAANAGTAAPMTSAPVVIALNDRILAELDGRTQRIRGRVASGRVVRLGTATHYG